MLCRRPPARRQLPAGSDDISYNRFVSTTQHRKDAPKSVRCFVLTISDTRTEANDTSGDAIRDLLSGAGHELTGRQIVRDDPDAVRGSVTTQAANADVIITTGGTGVTSRDSTYEAISGVLTKKLDGFGELFRMLSYEEIGSAAMLTRAIAGTIDRTAVFSLPGSEHAVRLAMTKLILPEIGTSREAREVRGDAGVVTRTRRSEMENRRIESARAWRLQARSAERARLASRQRARVGPQAVIQH